METRKVTVYATRGGNKAIIETDAETWGELKSLVEQEGFDLQSLEAGENINKTTLKHEDAKLPGQDFILFLRPKETKAGLTTYAEYKEKAKNDSEFKQFLQNKTGKNWTRCSLADYEEAWAAYTPENAGSAGEAYADIPVKSEEVNVNFTEEGQTLGEISLGEHLANLVTDVESKITQIKEVVAQMNFVANNLDKLKEKEIDAQAEEEAEKRRIEEEQRRAEEESLRKELEDFERGLE